MEAPPPGIIPGPVTASSAGTGVAFPVSASGRHATLLRQFHGPPLGVFRHADHSAKNACRNGGRHGSNQGDSVGQVANLPVAPESRQVGNLPHEAVTPICPLLNHAHNECCFMSYLPEGNGPCARAATNLILSGHTFAATGLGLPLPGVGGMVRCTEQVIA